MTHASAAGDAGDRELVTLDGRYHVLERIAAGGMGEVFLAQDAVLAREVAIKVLHRSLAGDQGFVDRFRREARAAATLNHPNIVAVYDWGSVDGIYYMVMERIRGRSLRELLNAAKRLEPAQAAEVVRQTLVALEHAHRKGIVHRDLKPENVLVTLEGVVKLTDLGLARAYADARATRTGVVTGTVQYLSPEQIRGEPADPRSDLYSLGILTYELLTGRLPFAGETPMSIAYKHLSDRVPAPSASRPSLPSDLDAFVLSATDPNRELRPESAEAMLRDLDSIRPELPEARSLASLVGDLPEVRPDPRVVPQAETTTASIPEPPPPRGRRVRRFLLPLLVLITVAAAAWGAWAYLVPHRVAVPPVAGRSMSEATTMLSDLGFTVRRAPGVFDAKVPAGRVLAVRPDPGRELDRGAVVTLVPSLGPRQVDVPAVTGKTLRNATRALQLAQLTVGATTRRYSDEVAAGHVISQRPSSGRADEHSAVQLVISRGPAPRAIPSVVGLDAATARTSLRDLGFSVTKTTRYSDTVARGNVIAVRPKETTLVAFGGTVKLVVSLGPETFPAPSFGGLTKDAAIGLAKKAGVRLSFFAIPGTAGTLVISQDPGPGATVHAGDVITLFLAG